MRGEGVILQHGEEGWGGGLAAHLLAAPTGGDCHAKDRLAVTCLGGGDCYAKTLTEQGEMIPGR